MNLLYGPGGDQTCDLPASVSKVPTIFVLGFLFICLFLDTAFLFVILTVLELCSVDQDSLELRDPLASTGIKGMCHHAELRVARITGLATWLNYLLL